MTTGLIIASGDLIGYSGSTSAVIGSHLHFKVNYFGKTVNPEKYLSVLINCLVR